MNCLAGSHKIFTVMSLKSPGISILWNQDLKYHEEDHTGPFPSLWKTDQNWPHQAALKTWSHVCVHLAVKDVVLQGKVSSPSKCSVFMGWHSSIFPEWLSICLGRRAGSEQDFPLQLLHLTAAAQHTSAEGQGTASSHALKVRRRKGMPHDEC